MTTEIFSQDKDRSPGSNIPELSVSDLAFSLKRTLEESFGRVRVRGELSRVKIHSSGHMYSDLKDAQAVLNLVCWRGTLGRLSVRPEEGLEVICTGRVTTYPARSNYQLVVESMELAGEGALLKMLEERRKKLAAEGVFDPARKRKLPFLPERIAVVTSPTGAVIRDILHRFADRFPREVVLWPVAVQGPGAADQIAAAVAGLNEWPAHLGKRPDLIIVARGGGALEDLMAFNEENVVRAVAQSAIPVIAAVGHETDTTLIDYAADVRAPTPTGAAEMAVPRRAELMARILENQERMMNAATRNLLAMRTLLQSAGRGLADPKHVLEMKRQAFDFSADRLDQAFEKKIGLAERRAGEAAARLRHPSSRIAESQRVLEMHGQALSRVALLLLNAPGDRLSQAARMLESLSFRRVLERGFVVVRDKNGKPVTRAADTRPGQEVALEFQDNKAVPATIGTGSGS